MTILRLLLLGAPQLLRVSADRQSRDGPAPDVAPYLNGEPGVPIHIGRRKAFALLAYLAMADRPIQRASLAALLWPEADQSTAHGYLRRDLAVVKKTVGADLLKVRRDAIRFARADDFALDVYLFRMHLNECTEHGHAQDAVCSRCLPALTAAVALYRGDFMQGFSLPDSPEFDEWQFFEAEQLRAEAMSALSRLVRGYVDHSEPDSALQYARRSLTLAPTHEAAHRDLMRLYAMTGNQAAARRQFEECTRILAAELNAAPDPETIQLCAAIKAGHFPVSQSTTLRTVPDTLTEETAAARETVAANELLFGSQQKHADQADRTPRNNLPPSKPPFIGREKELREISQLLVGEPECRLLTLIGPPGIGKSRLAIETGGALLHVFPDGVYVVYLASLRSVELIVQAIMDALSLPLRGQADPRVQLLNYLRTKRMLVILDNYEHFVFGSAPNSAGLESDYAGLLLDILTDAPQVCLLITSQACLLLQEEWVHEIRGLTYPSTAEMVLRPHDMPMAPIVDEYGAVRLFAENARRARSDITLTDTDLAAAVQICRTVEGLPLGIELATSWLRFMSCADIAERLQRDLAFMDTTLHNIPERHRSLNALFEHSWRYLTAIERDALRRLSIFDGGFTGGAAEQVAAAPLRVLMALIDKSVVRITHSGRYELHSILKHFARRRLEEDGEAMNETQDQHCAYYARFLQAREKQLRQFVQRGVFAEVAAEADNVRAAWDWATENKKTEYLEDCLEALHYFYYGQGWVTEGEAAFGRAVSALRPIVAESVEPKLQLTLARLVSRQGRFAYRLGRNRQARENLHEGFALATQKAVEAFAVAGNERAFCLYFLSAVERADGNYAMAETLGRQSLATYREIGDEMGAAGALKLLGIAAGSDGRYDEANALLNEALELFQTLDDRRGIANTLNDLGIVADRQGHYSEAEQLYTRCLSMRREREDVWGIAASLNNLGYLANLPRPTRPCATAPAGEPLVTAGNRRPISDCQHVEQFGLHVLGPEELRRSRELFFRVS